MTHETQKHPETAPPQIKSKRLDQQVQDSSAEDAGSLI